MDTRQEVRQPPDLLRLNQFAEQYRFIPISGLRWQIHQAKENGLEACGAILRVRNNPKSKRAMLFVSPSRYFAWMEQGGAKAA